MSEANKAIARRFIEEAFNKGNLAVLDEIVAPDHKDLGPGSFPDLPPGPEGSKRLVSVYRNAFPDVHLTIEDQVAEGDKVVTRWTGRGTHKGELTGIPPTGKSTVTTGMGIDRIVNGKIVESWGIFDQLGLLTQLGVVPPPPSG